MKKTLCKLGFAALAGLFCQSALAQTDVSALFMTNWGFDTQMNYTRGETGNVAQEILDVPGWTKEHEVDYTIVGTYEFGTAKKFNTNGVLPAEGMDGSRGGLALSTGWEQSLVYTQAVTLPAGSYHIEAAWYNGSNVTGGLSLVGWIPASGTSSMSTVKAFPKGQWTKDEVAFKLTKSTQGKVQLGLKAAAGGSGSTAKVVLDYVKIIMDDDAQAVTLVRSYLKSALSAANRQYGTGAGVNADQLKAVIDEAQATYDSEAASYQELFDAREKLLTSTDKYQDDNASESKPREITERYVQNPSFEQGKTGWVASNMNAQTNQYFTVKNGSTYMETWVGRGGQIADAGVSQVLRGLPRGKYRLSAAALHIQQSANESTMNKGAAQTGAFLRAGEFTMPITSMKTYKLDFSVVEEQGDVTIGAFAEGATGNWFCVDNFKLYFTGYLDSNAMTTFLQKECETAERYLAEGIQNTVREQVESALAAARALLETDGVKEDQIQEAIEAMQAANALAEASRARYLALQEAIDYARKVSGWWEGVAFRQTKWKALQTAIGTAEGKMVNYDLSDTNLKSAVTTLNTKVKAVDKQIYESDNAVGTGAALNNEASNWCYQRSLQSKHWILFWDKGYGDERPSGIDEILSTADQIFELYADSLHFININQGKSKSDTYKMIIRLKSSTEWEASGSGIDNTIGLLNLSRWAYTSRGGQTVAHEIGHCFQYQVHCDNNNWNGWMYTWADSPNGNVFWEMCAQWQAYKFYPRMQFNDNEWLWNTLNNLHKNPFCEEFRYNNFFIQDYMVQRHGWDFIGRLWNESQNPEDPFQAYMRMTMSGTTKQKLSQLGDEMWEYGARMATFDFDHLRDLGAATIGVRNQTAMTQQKDKYWLVNESDCPENYGHNAIKLNVPTNEKLLVAEFAGLADTTGYRGYNTRYAGWKVGFVALKNDGTRIYGDVVTATRENPNAQVEFLCPAGCKYVWLVVSGAPTSYWCRGWDGSTANDEQWPYKVRFYNTNLLGNGNTALPTAIGEVAGDAVPVQQGVYNLQGQFVGRSTTGLPAGIYVVGGRKVVVP